MAVSSKFSLKYQTKSISLPCRSHPSTVRIEEELNKIKTAAASKPSAETISNGLSQLAELYKCMDDLLKSSMTQNLISRNQNKKWVDELIDESVKFLDICGSIRDMVSQIKEHSRDLQCALRRRKGDLSTENSILKYNSFRKKMRKDVKGLVSSLKQVDNMIDGSSLVIHSDPQLSAVIRVVVEISEMTISVLESLLMFFTVPISKPNKWSLVVSKLIHKGMVACEDQLDQGTVNELENVDSTLVNLCKYKSSCEEEKIQTVRSRLESLEAQIESIESGLDLMYRRLIGARASLLNVVSQ